MSEDPKPELTPNAKLVQEQRKKKRVDRARRKFWLEAGKLFKEQVENIEGRKVKAEEIDENIKIENGKQGTIVMFWKKYQIIHATPIYSDEEGVNFTIRVAKYEIKEEPKRIIVP